MSTRNGPSTSCVPSATAIGSRANSPSSCNEPIMTNLPSLTTEGLRVFRAWLDDSNAPFPTGLYDGTEYTEPSYDLQIGPSKTFATRHEFGSYLDTLFTSIDFHELRAPKNDGLWAWIAVMYL